jgi:hypothetical protein
LKASTLLPRSPDDAKDAKDDDAFAEARTLEGHARAQTIPTLVVVVIENDREKIIK